MSDDSSRDSGLLLLGRSLLLGALCGALVGAADAVALARGVAWPDVGSLGAIVGLVLGVAVGAVTGTVLVLLRHRGAATVERAAVALPVVLAVGLCAWLAAWLEVPWPDVWVLSALTAVLTGAAARFSRPWWLSRGTAAAAPGPRADR